MKALTCSLKLWSRVAVSLEGTVDDIGSLVHEVWHDWLVHGSIPWDVSWLSHSVSVTGLVVLMEYWSLSSSPFLVVIWNWRVSWQHSSQIPPEQVWVVQQCSRIEFLIVEYNWSSESKTSSESLGDEIVDVEIGQPASNIEVLNWELSNNSKT